MRLTGPRAHARSAPTPTMPPGLVELMEGLAKDVLKNNPENVYEFCASHMQKLLEIRDGPAPPKKQLSLEQKVAKAQEKLRQRNKSRQLMRDTNLAKDPTAKLDHESQQPKEIPDVVTAIVPLIHPELITKKEVEIVHEPDVKITTKDTSTDDPQVDHKVNESSSNATHKHETEESLEEKVIDEVNQNSADIKEPTDVVVGKLEYAADLYEQRKDTVSVDIESTDHIDIRSIENTEAQHNESGPTVEDTDNIEEITAIDDLNSESPENKVNRGELNEAASSLLLESNTVAVFSNGISELKTTEKEIVDEPNIYLKDGKPETDKEEMLLQKIDVQVDPGKKVDDIIEEQKTTSQADPTSIQHEDQELNDIKSNVDDSYEYEKTNEKLLSKSDDSTDHVVGDLNIIEIETPLQTKSTQFQNPDLSCTDVKTSYSFEFEENKSSDNRVITPETTENPSTNDSFKNQDEFQDHDVHNSQVNYDESQDGKKPADMDYDLQEPGHAHSEELMVKNNDDIQSDTIMATKKDLITGNDKLAENPAVSGMDLETAAITIQKVFRTFLFSKSRASTLDDTGNENSLDEGTEKKDELEYALTSANINKERRTLGISRMDTVLQTVNEEKSLSLSDDSSLSSAATTIQAHVRGFLVRNRLASNKTASSSSLVNSDGPSTSLDGDTNEPKKTVLNIHIVPERGQFMSRDESLLTSIDLPLDNSPPSSINLHPLGYDKSERRKQLKREDAIQSISPPSNNSGKQSEDVDSVKEMLNEREDVEDKKEHEVLSVNNQDNDKPQEADTESCDTTLTISSTAETVIDAETYHSREVILSPENNLDSDHKNHEVVTSSDEMDVVTPPTISAKTASADTGNDEKPKLVHSGEFHDLVVQTKVKRSETSVVSGE